MLWVLLSKFKFEFYLKPLFYTYGYLELKILCAPLSLEN